MKSLCGNFSPCCLDANEFYKFSKTRGGWLFFSTLYQFIPQFVSSPFSQKWKNHHEWLGMESYGLQEVLVQQESNADTGFPG